MANPLNSTEDERDISIRTQLHLCLAFVGAMLRPLRGEACRIDAPIGKRIACGKPYEKQ